MTAALMTTTPMTFPRVPLKQMDASMLVFELDRETSRLMPEGAEMITSAATLASFLHRAETRSVRGDLPKVPYIEHPLRVALRLIRWGVRDVEIIVSALLHDVVENCASELLAVFGEPGETACQCLGRLYTLRVSDIVAWLTNPTDGTSYFDHMVELTRVAASSWWIGVAALLVKASDLKDNAGSLRHQMGHGDDAKMLERMGKYVPVVTMVAAALLRIRCDYLTHARDNELYPAIAQAAFDVDQLAGDVSQLAAEHGVRI